MSDDDATQTSRESEKGVVKVSDLRKLYQKAVTKDKSVQYRPLQDMLKFVNKNLAHWQGWNAVLQDDRLTYVNLDEQKSFNEATACETERTVGVLKNALMYVFMATKPNAAHSGVTHEELMTYLETSMSTHADHQLTKEHLDLLKKQIAPNSRADFIRKGYLTFSKSVNENDEEVFRYEWGPTSLQTVDPVYLVEVFRKLAGMDETQVKEQMERAKDLKQNQLDAIKNGAILPTRGKQN